MKKLLTLLILSASALCCQAQSIYYPLAYPTYRAYNLPLVTASDNVLGATDTVVSVKRVPITLTAGSLSIGGTVYTISNAGVVQADSCNMFWQSMTFNGGIECTVHRYANYSLERLLLINTDNTFITYFIR